MLNFLNSSLFRKVIKFLNDPNERCAFATNIFLVMLPSKITDNISVVYDIKLKVALTLRYAIFFIYWNKNDKKHIYTSTSDAPELSSARIQLELEDFQLGSARLVRFWAQLILQKIWHNELFVLFEDFEFSSCKLMDFWVKKNLWFSEFFWFNY